MTFSRLGCAAIAALAASAAPVSAQGFGEPVKPAPGGTPVRVEPWDEDEGGAWSDGILELSAYYAPWVRIRTDVSDDAFGERNLAEARIRDDDGFGIRLGTPATGDPWQASFGLGYGFSEHRERTTDLFAQVHSWFLDARAAYVLLSEEGQILIGADIGVGGMLLDFEKGTPDTGGAAFKVGPFVGIKVADRIEVDLEPGFFLAGYPTNTVLYGGYLALGLRVTF